MTAVIDDPLIAGMVIRRDAARYTYRAVAFGSSARPPPGLRPGRDGRYVAPPLVAAAAALTGDRLDAMFRARPTRPDSASAAAQQVAAALAPR